MSLFNRPRGVQGLLGSAFVALVAVSFLVTAAPSDDEVIHACVHTRNGHVRIVTGARSCRQSEVAVTWNKQGPPGPPGPRGEPGASRFALPDPQFRVGLTCFQCDLRGKSFIAAQLFGTRFWLTDVASANFSHAELINAQFDSFRSAEGADFSFADLRRAAFFDGSLRGANFAGALLDDASFDNVDLTAATGIPASMANSVWLEVT